MYPPYGLSSKEGTYQARGLFCKGVYLDFSIVIMPYRILLNIPYELLLSILSILQFNGQLLRNDAFMLKCLSDYHFVTTVLIPDQDE